MNSKGIKTKYSEFVFKIPSDLMDKLPSIKKAIVKVNLNSINETTLLNDKVSIPENAFIWVKLLSELKIKNTID